MGTATLPGGGAPTPEEGCQCVCTCILPWDLMPEDYFEEFGGTTVAIPLPRAAMAAAYVPQQGFVPVPVAPVGPAPLEFIAGTGLSTTALTRVTASFSSSWNASSGLPTGSSNLSSGGVAF